MPMLAWPLYYAEKELKLAVAVEGYDNDKVLLGAEVVAAMVRWLMESDGGMVLRVSTMEAMQRAREALAEGGESEATLVGLVDKWRCV
ncbi:unnamed protein product [Urochloa humidicola]